MAPARGGMILASDMQNGLFVLDASMALGIKESYPGGKNAAGVWPNPSTGSFYVKNYFPGAGPVHYEIRDISGRLLWNADFTEQAGSHEREIDPGQLPEGIYFLQTTSSDIRKTAKLVRR